MTMKTILRSGLALAAVMTIGMAQAQVKDDMKAAGHDTADATKTAAHKTAHGTKVAAKDTGHAVKKGTKKTVTGTRNVGRRIEDKPTVPNNPK